MTKAKAKKAAPRKKRPSKGTASKKAPARATGPKAEHAPSRLIDARIAALDDWRGETLARIRALIKQAAPDVIEEWKRRGVPVWSLGGIICTGETYKAVVKVTFAKGAALADPAGLFNASLEGKTRRAIDLREDDAIKEAPFKALVRAAATLNQSKPARGAAKPKLLSGGNPQIAKGYGDAPVQAYIAAMQGWQRDVGRRIDELVTRTVPGVSKAVKWNSPFYGVEEGLWFLSFHCFTKYVKVTFFRGTSLKPEPEGESKHAEVRHLDIREGELDEAQLSKWIKQASKLPGEKL